MKGRPKTAAPLNNGVQVRLPPELRDRVDKAAKKDSRTVSGFIRHLVEQWDQQQRPWVLIPATPTETVSVFQRDPSEIAAHGEGKNETVLAV
jgi:hypothetical protein